jgi:hypothetical protein
LIGVRKVIHRSWVEDLEARREKFDTEADKGLASAYAAAISEIKTTPCKASL